MVSLLSCACGHLWIRNTLTDHSVYGTGHLVYQFFMKMCNSCRTKDEYDRYHAELTIFLNLGTTQSVLSRDCINAIKEMKRAIRAREPKLAGYVRHGLKSHMLAMTTSPVEGQNKHFRHGEYKVGVNYHTDRALNRIMTRIQQNFRKRKMRADDELTSNCVFSNAWSGTYLIRKGQALVDRFHANRLFLKSARLSKHVYITWYFDLDNDYENYPDSLDVHLPVMLRVERLTLDAAGNFVKCSCGVREGVGLPCQCYFRIATNAQLTPNQMIDPCMADIRYWKLFHTHYETDTDIGRLLKRAQAEAFLNEGKGILVPTVVMDKLSSEASENPVYPQLGPNTTEQDFKEAMFVRNRSSTTLRDIHKYRDLDIKENFKDGAWKDVVGDDDFTTVTKLSPAGKKMQAAIEESVKEAEARRIAGRRFTRPSEDDLDDFYRWSHHKIRELNNCPKTSKEDLQLARDTMSAMFDKITSRKQEAFPETTDDGMELLGNYGLFTPPKKRKRGSY